MFLSKYFPALAVPNYRRFWITAWIALIGFWIQVTAQQWLVYKLTDSAFLLGLLSAMQFTPSLLFSLFIGFWIDRHKKLSILTGTQLSYLLQAASLAILLWTGHVSYAWLLFFAFVIGTIDAFDMPSRMALMPLLVGKEHLHNAIALNTANFNITRMLGPLLAAVLLSHLDYGSLFFLNACSLVPILITYRFMKVDEPRAAHAEKNAVKEIREGLACAKKDPVIFSNLLAMAAVSGFILNFGTYGPLFADRILGRGIEGFGAILFAIGAGSVAGGLLSAAGKKKTDARWLFLFSMACGLALCAVSRCALYYPALFLFALIGFFVIFFMINCNTAIQLASPPDFLGRIMSLYAFVFLGSAPFGNLFVSAVIESFGTADGLFIVGVTEMTSMLLIGWKYWKK